MIYRHDISPTLKLLVFVLIVFIGYQAWVKPTYLATKPTFDHRPSTLSLSPSPEFALSETQPDPLLDVPPSRLVTLGAAPNQTLGSIREELDKGNYQSVEQRLKILSRKTLTNRTARRYVAAMWNNLGVQQEKFGGTVLSVNAFKQSVAWDSTNPLAHLNLLQAYWELRDPAMTPQFLQTVMRIAPEDPFPHLVLADLLLSQGSKAAAATHLEHARPRAVHDSNHQSYLRNLTAKLEASGSIKTTTGGNAQASQVLPSDTAWLPATAVIHPPLSPTISHDLMVPARTPPPQKATPYQPTQSGTPHFIVQFDGPPDPTTWTRMQAILEYAYEELSQKFGHIPSKPVGVILHTNQTFNDTTGSPLWADSLFDRSMGSMHLPTIGALEDLAAFSRVARHQFMHALLFEYLGGQSSLAPTWLIEGLAIHLAEDPWSDLEEIKPETTVLIPLTSLEGEWRQLPEESFAVAYLEARSATQILAHRFSLDSIRQVVTTLRNGQVLDTALRTKFSLSYEEFQRLWEKDFSSLIGRG